jgi:RsiW-degrading membrane proteinase PrsW (M82 family)
MSIIILQLTQFFSDLSYPSILLAFCSVLPWSFFLYVLHPGNNNRKLLIALIALGLGVLSTKVILSLHPVIWPEVDFRPKRTTTILSQTVYISFIQAGMMEETFKELFILLLGLAFAFNRSRKTWTKDIVLIGGFVAFGFAFIENYVYLSKDTNKVLEMFLGRTIFSSNIHLLINLCFALFLLKSNEPDRISDKLLLVFYGYLLAIIQHGVVDFFLLPGSRFGSWLATAMFVGIWVWVVRDMRRYVYQM